MSYIAEVQLPFRFRETDTVSMVSRMSHNLGEGILRSTLETTKEHNEISLIFGELFDALKPQVESSVSFTGVERSQEHQAVIRLGLVCEEVNEPTEHIARQILIEEFIKFAELYRSQLNY